METKLRSIIKTLSFELICAITTAIVVFLWTHNILESIISGILVMLIDSILYFFHERLWAKIRWGYR